MPTYDATPSTWTLKFKNAKTTVVLHVDSLTTFATIKIELLHALQSTCPSGSLNGMTLPSSADDIELAKPRDFSNVEKGGWQSIEADALNPSDAEDFEEEQAAFQGKGKGKAKAKPKGKSHQDCPLGAGLKDMCPVAFRFKGQKQVKKVADDEDEGLGLEEEGDVQGDDGWDVELPKFEDVYGLEDLVPDDQLTTPKANKFASYE